MKKSLILIFAVTFGLCFTLPALASLDSKAWTNSSLGDSTTANAVTEHLIIAGGGGRGMGGGGGGNQGGGNQGNNNDGDGDGDNQNNDGDGDGDNQNNDRGDRGD